MVFLQDIGIFQKIADTDTELFCSVPVFREQLSTMYLTLFVKFGEHGWVQFVMSGRQHRNEQTYFPKIMQFFWGVFF
jgi:hypothetical protein